MKNNNYKKDLIYIDIALNIARFSHAKRRKVGCVILSKDGKILGTGYNGTPSGTDNSCENSENITQPYVIHAEENAVLNSEKTNLKGSTVYVTLSPCVHCASVLIQKKVKRVVYYEKYRDDSGIKYLEQNGVVVDYILNDNKSEENKQTTSVIDLIPRIQEQEEIERKKIIDYILKNTKSF